MYLSVSKYMHYLPKSFYLAIRREWKN